MNITVPVVVSWLFAAWWLVVGIRDFNLIRYDAAGSARYRRPFPLLLCLAASITLATLGYFLSKQERQPTLTALFIFAVIWITWSVIAKRSWRKR
jgi:hypothetical protein